MTYTVDTYSLTVTRLPHKPAVRREGSGMQVPIDRMRTRVVKKLSSQQGGALKLARRYGAALVCVRYRQDMQGLHRYTTVELVVDEAPVASKRADATIVDDPITARLTYLFRPTTPLDGSPIDGPPLYERRAADTRSRSGLGRTRYALDHPARSAWRDP